MMSNAQVSLFSRSLDFVSLPSMLHNDTSLRINSQNNRRPIFTAQYRVYKLSFLSRVKVEWQELQLEDVQHDLNNAYDITIVVISSCCRISGIKFVQCS